MSDPLTGGVPEGNPIEFIRSPTPRLKAFVPLQRAQLPQADFEQLIGTVRSIFFKYLGRLTEFPEGRERARALHRMMNEAMKAADSLPLTCGRGCSGCCHYEIEITEGEAALLAEAVAAGVAIDTDRLATQAARERRSPRWSPVISDDNRCVFLGGDGACRVYESRPSACRRHVVTSPAHACATPGEAVAPVEVLLAEILLSAALSIEGTRYASLSKMLTAALGAP